MKVVSFSGSKTRPQSKKREIQSRSTFSEVPKRIEIKVPELDPVLTRVIDFKGPLLNNRVAHTNRDYVPARNIALEKRPKTVQAKARTGKEKEPPLKRGAYYRPISKMTQRKTKHYHSPSQKKVESIYYLRSKSQATPYAEMPQPQNLAITRTIPSILQPRERPLCYS